MCEQYTAVGGPEWLGIGLFHTFISQNKNSLSFCLFTRFACKCPSLAKNETLSPNVSATYGCLFFSVNAIMREIVSNNYFQTPDPPRPYTAYSGTAYDKKQTHNVKLGFNSKLLANTALRFKSLRDTLKTSPTEHTTHTTHTHTHTHILCTTIGL